MLECFEEMLKKYPFLSWVLDFCCLLGIFCCLLIIFCCVILLLDLLSELLSEYKKVSCNKNGILEEQSISRVYWFFNTIQGYYKKELNFMWSLMMDFSIDRSEKVEILEGHLDLLKMVHAYCLICLIKLSYLDIKQFSVVLNDMDALKNKLYPAEYMNCICNLYSFVYEPENCRYTLEIREEKGKYQLVQIQKKYNQGCSDEARQYVQQFI